MVMVLVMKGRGWRRASGVAWVCMGAAVERKE